MSYSDEKTEKQLKKLERELASLYKEAYEEMSKEADKYFAQYEERWEKEYQAFLDGAYTELEFKNWEATQLARGQQWERLRDTMAKRLRTANQTASAYINDSTPSVYSLNANYEAYQIAKETGTLSESWNMIDEQAVKTLITEQRGKFSEFKVTNVNAKRDYAWNSQQIQRALNAGILQGKSIDKIADSFMVVMKRNRTSAIRNARTAFTSAQNAGRVNSLKQAKEMGIDVKKKWTSSGDESVRFSHAMLNGQIRDIEERFSNGLMHPADSDGEPKEVYNCRCRLTYVYPKYEKVQSNEAWEEMSPEQRKAEEKKYIAWQRQNKKM